jgi:hypothetical protein
MVFGIKVDSTRRLNFILFLSFSAQFIVKKVPGASTKEPDLTNKGLETPIPSNQTQTHKPILFQTEISIDFN